MQKNRIKRWIFLFSLLIVCFLLVSCQTGASTGGSSEVMAVRGYYPVVRGQIALTLPMTDDDITGFIETSKELIESIYQ